jgi:hypothetical protein
MEMILILNVFISFRKFFIIEICFEFEFWCLTPLSAIFQLYHGDQL